MTHLRLRRLVVDCILDWAGYPHPTHTRQGPLGTVSTIVYFSCLSCMRFLAFDYPRLIDLHGVLEMAVQDLTRPVVC